LASHKAWILLLNSTETDVTALGIQFSIITIQVPQISSIVFHFEVKYLMFAKKKTIKISQQKERKKKGKVD
jgi:hypothetical protein